MKGIMIKMKYISFYLPQFHEIPENNEWWGKGFTEWTNTKKARPLFKGHEQPKTPLNENYYDLNLVETMEWQVSIAKKHGIYGFCFYHYWFNGKRLLEKPLINYLNNKHIDFPFCLSWANEPWTRSWDGGEKDILMPQSYGDAKEWKQHFECLYEYFVDPRYIRMDNKPVLLIYRPSSIANCAKMLKFLNELALSKGLKGIYFIETIGGFDNKFIDGFQASVEFEPMYTIYRALPFKAKHLSYRIIRKLGIKMGIDPQLFLYKVDYDEIWNYITNRKIKQRRTKHFLGSFVSWDNTARKKEAGLVVKNSSVEKFLKYNKLQIERSKKIDSEFIFINAWNEWAEGTYLEPDTLNGYGYLEALGKLIRKERE